MTDLQRFIDDIEQSVHDNGSIVLRQWWHDFKEKAEVHATREEPPWQSVVKFPGRVPAYRDGVTDGEKNWHYVGVSEPYSWQELIERQPHGGFGGEVEVLYPKNYRIKY